MMYALIPLALVALTFPLIAPGMWLLFGKDMAWAARVIGGVMLAAGCAVGLFVAYAAYVLVFVARE